MSFPSPSIEEPRQDSLPSQTKGNSPRRQRKNNRAKNDNQQPQQSQLSSPSLNSIPSSTISSKPAHLADSETVSTASLESSKSSRRRRRARGGGRKNRSKNHIASQQQDDDLDANQTSQPPLEDVAEKELYGYDDDLSDSHRSAQGQHSESHPENKQDQGQGQQAKPSDTGIRSFNIRRSDPNGGRPVGMKPQRKRKGKGKASQDHCAHCGQSTQPSTEAQAEGQESSLPETLPRIPRISVKQNPRQEPGHKPEQERGQEESREKGNDTGQEQQSKEFSIKIDLNLELEIAFKAKVKGEIMLTFLEWNAVHRVRVYFQNKMATSQPISYIISNYKTKYFWLKQHNEP